MRKHELNVLRAVDALAADLFPSVSTRVERIEEGVSTRVFRITAPTGSFYLRVLPEEGASFAPEITALKWLREMGARVPEVLYFAHRDGRLGLSVMVTAEIKGRPICRSSSLPEEQLVVVAGQAGQDLALINSIPVEGFGWMDRDPASDGALRAEWPTHRAFALESWEADLIYLSAGILPVGDIEELRRTIIRYDAWLDVPHARLAHGDFDTTHIYQDAGRYTGVIDFGEIRGASSWYDLGHFHVRDGEWLPIRLLPALARGYGEAMPLPVDWEARVRLAAILINVRALARAWRKGPPNRYTQHQGSVLAEDIAWLGRW